MQMFGAASLDEEAKKKISRKLLAVHNRECDFYERFGKLGLVPLPEIYYLQKLNLDGGTYSLSRLPGYDVIRSDV
jgi:Protein of unknown function (DUF1679)